MMRMKNHSNSEQDEDKPKREAVLAYLTKKNRIMAAFSAILSILLFTIWTIRSGLDFLIGLVLVTSHGISSVIVASSDYRGIDEVGKKHLVFRKSAISWKFVTDALIGLGLSFFFLWFVFASNEANSQIVGQLVMLAAMICTVIVMPIFPLLGLIPTLGIMKSKITAQTSNDYSSIIELDVHIHPLDNEGMKLSHMESFNSTVKTLMLEFLKRE
jgi:Na+/H+-translocating membrane pyrophosphatase